MPSKRRLNAFEQILKILFKLSRGLDRVRAPYKFIIVVMVEGISMHAERGLECIMSAF